MTDNPTFVVDAVVVEDEVRFSLADLCRVCRADSTQVIVLVDEGVLQPAGRAPDEWLFSGASLRRARVALRLDRDLEIGPAGLALALDLLDEIETLRARLRRAGVR